MIGPGDCCCFCRIINDPAVLTHPAIPPRLQAFGFDVGHLLARLAISDLNSGCNASLTQEVVNNFLGGWNRVALFYSHDDELTDTHVFERVPGTGHNPLGHHELNIRMSLSRSVTAPIAGKAYVRIRRVDSLVISYADEILFSSIYDPASPFPYPGDSYTSSIPGTSMRKTTVGCPCFGNEHTELSFVPRFGFTVHDTFIVPKVMDATNLPAIVITTNAGPDPCNLLTRVNSPDFTGQTVGVNEVDGWQMMPRWEARADPEGNPWGPDFIGPTFATINYGRTFSDVGFGFMDVADPIVAWADARATSKSVQHLNIQWRMAASALETMAPFSAAYDNDWEVFANQWWYFGGPSQSCDDGATLFVSE